MQFTLDQRQYRLNITKKQLCDECNSRGRKISYPTVCKVIEEPNEASYKTKEIVSATITEMELERGIVSSESDF